MYTEDPQTNQQVPGEVTMVNPGASGQSFPTNREFRWTFVRQPIPKQPGEFRQTTGVVRAPGYVRTRLEFDLTEGSVIVRPDPQPQPREMRSVSCAGV